jgi:S1-C subfamily serine protease
MILSSLCSPKKRQMHLTYLIPSITVILFFFFPLTHLQAGEAISKKIRSSVIKISVIAQFPDYAVPWNPGQIRPATGTGFIIADNRILTNAHLASNARFIAVEKEGDSRKYEARVKFIAHDCDLAILDVLNPSFFDGTAPLTFGGMPSLDSTVTVIGYPIGGSLLSVTRGVVSRIDYQTYSHSAADSHLAIQIDAAVNPGNSGGPVLQDNAVIGVVFQGYSADVAQNVGYMIPVPAIQRFLTDVADGNYDHYVDLGIFTFPLINATHRRAVGLKSGDYGVVVSQIITAGRADGILEVGDVLLSIDDLPIFSDGSVEMDSQRVQMAEVVERKFKGDTVRLKVLRANREMNVTLPLNSPWPYLMVSRRHDVRPQFVLFGGLVFQPLSRGFLEARKIDAINIRYYYSLFLDNEIYLDHPEVIVLGKVLPDPINAYHGKFVNSIVDKINGKKIRTLLDVSEAFQEPSDYHVIHFLGISQPVVLEHQRVITARKRILHEYGVLKEEHLADSIVPADVLKKLYRKN